jgi:hypothetical protein
MEGLAEMALARAQYQGPSPLPAVLLASRGLNPARRAARSDTLRAYHLADDMMKEAMEGRR